MGRQVAIFMLLISGGEVLGEERRRDRREVEDGGGREVCQPCHEIDCTPLYLCLAGVVGDRLGSFSNQNCIKVRSAKEGNKNIITKQVNGSSKYCV